MSLKEDRLDYSFSLDLGLNFTNNINPLSFSSTADNNGDENDCLHIKRSVKKCKMDGLHYYLSTGNYKPGLSETEKKRMRDLKKNHFVNQLNNKLMCRKKGRNLEIITNEDKMLEIISLAHTGLGGKHLGLSRTYAKVHEIGYHWATLRKDILKFITNCLNCTRYDSKVHKSVIFKSKVTQPWETVGMALLGPYIKTIVGNVYVAAFIDHYTKFVEFLPIHDNSALVVASCIRTFCLRWGFPLNLLSDQSDETIQQINECLCHEYRFTRAMVSQSGGPKRWTYRRIRSQILELVRDWSTIWDSKLDEVAYSLRIEKFAKSQESPFSMLFGREPRTWGSTQLVYRLSGESWNANAEQQDEGVASSSSNSASVNGSDDQ